MPHINMNANYDTSWDLDEGDKGYSSASDEAFEKKCEEWESRDWMKWLGAHLTFPFTATREEDMDDASSADADPKTPFQVGHKMEVLGLAGEDEYDQILAKARENSQIGSVPLCDLEVTSKADPNYWPVREYVVWIANRT